jgi:sarcosine oxidase delta subunit
MLYTCRKCQFAKPESEFYIHSTSGKRRTYCATCIKAESKEQYHRSKTARNGAPDPRYAHAETKRHIAKVERQAQEVVQETAKEAAIAKILALCDTSTPKELRAAAKVLEQRQKWRLK